MTAAAFPKFTDWATARGINLDELHEQDGDSKEEAARKRDRLNQLQQFHSEAKREFRVVEAQDSSGQPLKIGDMVTMTFRVDAIHPAADGKPASAALNLSRQGESGQFDHYLSAPAGYVKKA